MLDIHIEKKAYSTLAQTCESCSGWAITVSRLNKEGVCCRLGLLGCNSSSKSLCLQHQLGICLTDEEEEKENFAFNTNYIISYLDPR